MSELEYVKLTRTGCKGRILQWYPVTVRVMTYEGYEVWWDRKDVEPISAAEWFSV